MPVTTLLDAEDADSNHGYKVIGVGKLGGGRYVRQRERPAPAVPLQPFRQRQAASDLAFAVPAELRQPVFLVDKRWFGGVRFRGGLEQSK